MWKMSYGARYFRFQDEFAVTGFGGTLGNSFWDMELRNQPGRAASWPALAQPKWSLDDRSERPLYVWLQRDQLGAGRCDRQWAEAWFLQQSTLPGDHDVQLRAAGSRLFAAGRIADGG